MSWQNEISVIVRHLINDTDSSSYKYDDSRIETSILVGAQLVILELTFKNDYTIDISNGLLSPDPTLQETRDNYFINLASLRTACIIIGSEVKSEAGNAIAIKDGPSSIDLRGVTATLSALHTDICSKYQLMVEDYKKDKFNGEYGTSILGPYSPGSDFANRQYNRTEYRDGYF
jgi:hypothetical protein